MIDYVKIHFKNIDTTRLFNLPFLDFKTVVNLKTGVSTTKKTVTYHFCKITIYDNGTVLFTGSIHKMHNSINGVLAPNHNTKDIYKGFNGNKFTFSDMMEIKIHLVELFNCLPKQMIFQNIELGVNTTPYFNPQLFLTGLLYHNGKLFEYKYNNRFSQVKHQRYLLKIYNKSEQYGMSENTLRIELKIIKTEFLKQTGIKTFADVTTETLKRAEILLLKAFDEVVYYDNTISKKNLSKREKQSLKSYSNPRYWINNLKPQHRHRHKKKLEYLIHNYSEDLKKITSKEIVKKCVIINRNYKKPKCVIINSSYIGLNITQNTLTKPCKKCPITGIDLSKEKEGAKYIRNTTIKHLKKNDVSMYYKLCSLLLRNSNPKHTKFEKNIISHLAKQVRNRYYNQRAIKQKGYKNKKSRTQLILF